MKDKLSGSTELLATAIKLDEKINDSEERLADRVN